MSDDAPYPLFSVLGIEIEYMLVDKDTLSIQPKSDVILHALAGGTRCNEVILGDIAMSNELVLHVIELKNHGPKPLDAPVIQHFQQAIEQLQPILQQHHLCLLPSAAHPWMNPFTETQCWPHDQGAIYQQYNTIFGCHGHGWSNLQSMHVNLPFANDHEFFQLHSAIRLLMPLLPALAASSPFIEQSYTGKQDTRLYFYGINQQRIPSISGAIIPEFVHSLAEYDTMILQPMYRDIRPLDPQGILQFPWLNSRGAIPKWKEHAIEIRILDTQECVASDIAIAKAIVEILRYWLNNTHYFLDIPCDTALLASVYQQTIHHGLHVEINDSELTRQWQLPPRMKNCRDVWEHLIAQISSHLDFSTQKILENILIHGNLSERLLRAAKGQYDRHHLTPIYQKLRECLLKNQPWMPI